jgi:hypothetical protein
MIRPATVLIVTILVTSDSEACMCQSPGRSLEAACRSFRYSSAVFSGRVTSVQWTGGVEITIFAVTEAFRGVTSRTIEVIGGRTESCYFEFKPGESYFVYADADPHTGRLTAELCSGTKLLQDAAADLAYVAGHIRLPLRLAVSVWFFLPTSPGEPRRASGLDGVPVTIGGPGGIHTFVTSHGPVVIDHPMPGIYEIHVDVPPPFRAQADVTTVLGEEDCEASVSFGVSP